MVELVIKSPFDKVLNEAIAAIEPLKEKNMSVQYIKNRSVELMTKIFDEIQLFPGMVWHVTERIHKMHTEREVFKYASIMGIDVLVNISHPQITHLSCVSALIGCTVGIIEKAKKKNIDMNDFKLLLETFKLFNLLKPPFVREFQQLVKKEITDTKFAKNNLKAFDDALVKVLS